MSKIPAFPSILACAALAFAGAGPVSTAHAQNSPIPSQNTSPATAPSQNKAARPWSTSKTSTHAWTNSQSTGAAMAASMGATGGNSARQCSQKAFTKGLWGKARRRFIRKCMDTRPWTNSQSTGAAMGAPMGGMKTDSKVQQCSHKAMAKGLWGKARKRFMKKCLKMS